MTIRKKYPKEFKLDAISLVLDQGYTRTEAARSLGINIGVDVSHCFESRVTQNHLYLL